MKGKHIIVGVTGGIAAYKTCTLVREMVRRGAEVQVVMTPMARQFVAPLTFATLSRNPILVDFFNPENGQWNSHVSLGLWADAMVIAPATANTIAKMAAGIADNLLLTTYLSARCPVFVAPAMDLDMLAHEATQLNIKTLLRRGNVVIDAADGELASGLSGKGRMAEPENIARRIDEFFSNKSATFEGMRVMLTAGPTYEKIDPVRFIGNYSSGKMGFAIAEELAARGAAVELIAGPVQLKPRHTNIILTKVESAQEMYEAACQIFPQCQGAIMTAAVADYTPKHRATEKLKRHGAMTIDLEPTPDIAAAMGRMKHDGQFLVGFALETNDEHTAAKHKLESKNLDFIVLNSLRDEGAGFMVDTNKVTIIERNGQSTEYPLKPKTEVARDIVDRLESIISKHSPA